MVYELTENYLPSRFLYREEQIQKIETTFKIFNESKNPMNLIIFGCTGAGKTSIVSMVMKKYSNHIYVSCSPYNSLNKLLRHMTGLSYHSNSDLQVNFIKKMKANPKILVLDEINKIRDFKEFCEFLNILYREVYIPIILITNKWNLIEDIPEDARLTLCSDRADFGAYKADQIQEILKDRLSLIKDKIEVDDGALSCISAFTVSKHLSSVRVALDVLRKCIIKKDFSQQHIIDQFKNVQKQDWLSFIYKLNDTEKQYLHIILDLLEKDKEISLQTVNELLPSITMRRISQITDNFKEYGLLSTRYLNRGRAGGDSKIIYFSEKNKKDKEELLEILYPNDDGMEVI